MVLIFSEHSSICCMFVCLLVYCGVTSCSAIFQICSDRTWSSRLTILTCCLAPAPLATNVLLCAKPSPTGAYMLVDVFNLLTIHRVAHVYDSLTVGSNLKPFDHKSNTLQCLPWRSSCVHLYGFHLNFSNI